jgi:hypothetical protein
MAGKKQVAVVEKLTVDDLKWAISKRQSITDEIKRLEKEKEALDEKLVVTLGVKGIFQYATFRVCIV